MANLRGVEDLDLDRHGVLEASAGTGKTFALQRLVLRLLREKRVQPEHILLVTYTEKATGELRGRLRATLEQELQQAGDQEQQVLREALDQFDQMPIFTIHAACQKLLRDHAFDQRHDFKPQLVDDRALLKPCLREIQRKHWREEYGEELRNVLANSGYDRDGAKQWDETVLELAERLRPGCGHRLLPEAAVPGRDEQSLAQSQLTAGTVRQLQQLLREHKRQRGLMSFEDMLTRVDESLDPERNKHAAALVGTLRERFRYAIVDEFQDTDPLQWRIFSRLFLEGGPGRLFVVGDPKQAIFKFRGADLETYQSAVQDMTNRYGAQSLPLDVNWRSSADLLRGLNRLFGQGDWFPESLPYRPVEPASDSGRQSEVLHDVSGRAALTLVRIGGDQTLKRAQRQFARFAVGEIQRLLHQPPTLRIKDKVRPLQREDIGVLVFRRAEADFLTKGLGEAGIPYSLYKQAGLWTSDEALQVEALLKALARPDQRTSLTRALLTRFFRVPATDLAHCDDLPGRHPARVLFDDWVELAQDRRWAALFQTMLERSGILHTAYLGVAEGERRLANYRHILGTLEQAAYAHNLDLCGVLELLHARRTLRDGRDDDLQPIETDRDKVRILTIHASKGLEFPVVFLAGGFTAGVNERFTSYHVDGKLVYDLHPDDDARERAKTERDAEKRRLLYVALTRAMVRVYLPWVTVSSTNHAGPLPKIVTPALDKSQVAQLGPPAVGCLDCPRSGRMVAAVGATTVAPAPQREVVRIDDPERVFPRLDPDLRQRRIVVRSFSSIHRKLMLRVAEEATFGDEPPRFDDDVPDAVEEYDPLRGPVFGDMVHKVLERVDFAAVGGAPDARALVGENAPLDGLLQEQLERNLLRLHSRTPQAALAQACRERIAELVWAALRTPLAALGGPLWQVPAVDRVHELEFHFPEASSAPLPAEVRREEGFLTGIMDLVVRRHGRIFLIDWKTNFLGGYTPEAVAEAMRECDYIRQYRLYLQALARWLNRDRGGAPQGAREFGGVYYLFLRGLNGKDESSGVHFCRPTAEDLELSRVLVEN